MNLIRKISLVLAALLALSMGAMAEPADLQAQLDAANERIAALEAEVELYRSYCEAKIVAEFGGGVVWLEDAKKTYDEAAAMYAQYGISVDAYANEIKQSILEGMVQDAVLEAKAVELGISEPDEAALAELTEKAAEDFNLYVDYYGSYFATEGASDEENRQAAIDGLNAAGITQESLLASRLENYGSERLHDYVTKDLTVTDEELQAKYQELIETDKSDFAEDYSFNASRMDGETIAWYPEGYRTVKHVLIKFSDEQGQQYSELQSALSDLNAELEALDKPEEETEEATEEETAEEETAEEEQPPRTREEIQTDIGAIGASIEALYAELMPKAQEVVDAFNKGTDFDTLIAQYNEDPGMQSGIAATEGYAVAENSTYWDPAFTEGAMSIAEIGQISEPVRGQYGVHIIYYLADITPGEVPFEDIKDGVEAAALESKAEETYDAQIQAWVEEANPVYHMDRFN